MARSLGASHTVDYTQEDFTQTGQQYDLVFDTVGNHSVAAYRRALKPAGHFVTTAFLPTLLVLGPWISFRDGQKMVNMMAKPNRQDLLFLKSLLETGQVVAVIDRCYAIDEVPQALRYLQEGHAKGKVIVSIS